MNQEMIKGLGERIGVAIALYLVSKGILPEGLQGPIAEIVALAIIAGVSIFFGVKLNTQSSLVQAAASMPDVKKVVVNDNLDASKISAPDAKVTQS